MDSLEDPLWYRIANLRPRLNGQVRIQRRVTRGRILHMLCDDVRRRYHRVDEAAWHFVGRLDGKSTVDEIWHTVHRKLGEAAPSQGEVLRILAQLAASELLTQHQLLDPAQVVSRKRKRERQIRAAAVNPLAFKVPMFDPSRLLEWLLPLARVLFTSWAGLLWLLLIGVASMTANSHWSELGAALKANARAPSFLLCMWLAYPFIKTLHETCHAMAVRVWGGEVREVGLTLVLLTPLPYVDASAATAFESRQRRMMVSAVGVAAELAIAALFLLVWSATSSPQLQQLSLAITACCGISTLLFNANPLARFDGYHVLCDALDLPNLAQRSRAVIAHLFQHLLGASPSDNTSPEASTREMVGLAVYGVLSWTYQLLVLLIAAWWLYPPYPLLAMSVGVLGTVGLVGRPLIHAAGFLLLDNRLAGRRVRALTLSGGTVLALLVGIFFVPAPSFTVQKGVVWAPPEAIVRVETDGELRTLTAINHQRVSADQTIGQLDNLALRGERAASAGRLQELEVQYFDALLTKPPEAGRLAMERDAVHAGLERLDQRIAALTLKTRSEGILLMPRDGGQEGHFYRQGKELGYVLSGEPGLLVKVALSESQAALVRERTTTVSVLLEDGPPRIVPGTLDRETPSVTRTLPSAVLGSAAGGPVLTDPSDTEGRQTLAPVGLVDVRVPGEPARWIGARVWVRFDHASEPLGHQWVRSLKQAFLSGLAT
jgi:putative peptide zinc metalloprotease protein